MAGRGQDPSARLGRKKLCGSAGASSVWLCCCHQAGAWGQWILLWSRLAASLWVPLPTAAAIVGEDASLGDRKVLCLWRKGLTSTPGSSCSVLFFITLTTQGCVPPKGCTAGSCCFTLHLLSFKEKLLASQRGNVEKRVMQAFAYPTSPVPGYRKSGQEPCDLECAAWSGILISSSSQPWGQPHAPQAEWRRALAPLGNPSGCCSFCSHPPCCSPGAVLVGTDDP